MTIAGDCTTFDPRVLRRAGYRIQDKVTKGFFTVGGGWRTVDGGGDQKAIATFPTYEEAYRHAKEAFHWGGNGLGHGDKWLDAIEIVF